MKTESIFRVTQELDSSRQLVVILSLTPLLRDHEAAAPRASPGSAVELALDHLKYISALVLRKICLGVDVTEAEPVLLLAICLPTDNRQLIMMSSISDSLMARSAINESRDDMK